MRILIILLLADHSRPSGEPKKEEPSVEVGAALSFLFFERMILGYNKENSVF